MKLNKSFDPETLEKKWYEIWEKNGYFSSDIETTKPSFCIQLPPPNVTGTLHMGHAFQQTLMDILIRYHRMKGFNTNWIVGTDHAGIATQIVVERQIEAEGKNKKLMGRENFLDKVWEWKKKSGLSITQQMRRLGASANWNYADTEKSNAGYFTMDKKMSESVVEVFIQLYKKGLIYKGKRLVNWDPTLQTAVSDLEVESEEEKGKIWEIKYQIFNSNETLNVATTRPETLLGDTAVAVSPEDDRYKKYIGGKIILPITKRVVPIIADEYVDPLFGTGCVKITPAHDFNDYEMGVRHKLDMINIFTLDGRTNKNCPEILQGMDRFKARDKVLEILNDERLLVSEKEHILKIPRSGRTGAIVEPMLTDQWFVKMDSMASKARLAVERNEVEFVPSNWSNTYFHWLDNIKDWCISRQLWWGHQIPAWYDKKGNVFVARNESQAYEQAKLKPSSGLLTRDCDVLDTWFSSALVPFSSLGWPKNTRDMNLFLPSNILITGFDIIFFWVARMIMMSLEFTNTVPFKKVYINALVRDSDGKKMSKSKGNTVDPIDLIDGIEFESLLEKSTKGLLKTGHKQTINQYLQKNYPNGIKAYGADALRFTFASLATFSRTLNFDLNRCDGYRNFCNKLWNASRFVLMQCNNPEYNFQRPAKNKSLANKPMEFSVADRWIVSKLNSTIHEVEKAYKDFRFDIVSGEIYRFVWDEYCDWYLEIAKTQLQSGSASEQMGTLTTLLEVLETTLRLAHPIIPFITEELWQKVAPIINRGGESVMISEYPIFDESKVDYSADSSINLLKNVVIGARKLKVEMNISANERVPLRVEGNIDTINQWRPHLIHLAKVKDVITQNRTAQDSQKSPAMILGDFRIMLEVIIDVEKEKKRLDKELKNLQDDIHKLKDKISNVNFIKKAPAGIVEKEKNRLAAQEVKLRKIISQIRLIETPQDL